MHKRLDNTEISTIMVLNTTGKAHHQRSNTMSKTLTTIGGTQVLATEKQIEALAILDSCRKGTFARVIGYVPTTGWVKGKSPVMNLTAVSGISGEKHNNRMGSIIENIEYPDIADYVITDPVLSVMRHVDLLELFDVRKGMLLESINKTKSGDRSDAHRQGHDRCYIHSSTGVKVNLVTEPDEDGLKQPVLENGFPQVASILISCYFVDVTTTTEGERKVVNSGDKVRMSNVIKRAVGKTCVSLKTLSLKGDNFDSLTIDHNTIVPDDMLNMQ